MSDLRDETNDGIRGFDHNESIRDIPSGTVPFPPNHRKSSRIFRIRMVSFERRGGFRCEGVDGFSRTTSETTESKLSNVLYFEFDENAKWTEIYGRIEKEEWN